MLVVALLTLPGLRLASDFGAVSLTNWFVALVAGFIGVIWCEIYQTLARR